MQRQSLPIPWGPVNGRPVPWLPVPKARNTGVVPRECSIHGLSDDVARETTSAKKRCRLRTILPWIRSDEAPRLLRQHHLRSAPLMRIVEPVQRFVHEMRRKPPAFEVHREREPPFSVLTTTNVRRGHPTVIEEVELAEPSECRFSNGIVDLAEAQFRVEFRPRVVARGQQPQQVGQRFGNVVALRHGGSFRHRRTVLGSRRAARRAGRSPAAALVTSETPATQAMSSTSTVTGRRVMKYRSPGNGNGWTRK